MLTNLGQKTQKKLTVSYPSPQLKQKNIHRQRCVTPPSNASGSNAKSSVKSMATSKRLASSSSDSSMHSALSFVCPKSEEKIEENQKPKEKSQKIRRKIEDKLLKTSKEALQSSFFQLRPPLALSGLLSRCASVRLLGRFDDERRKDLGEPRR